MRQFLLSLFLFLSLNLQAADPAGRLFRFERSTNRNYICYDIQLADGHLDMKHPIHVYRIRAEEDGRQQELNYLQRKLAFGYKVISRGNEEVTVHLTAYKDLPIRICRRDGRWVALVTINGQEAELSKMFAQMRSPNSLHVEYVDIFGLSRATHTPIRQRITP